MGNFDKAVRKNIPNTTSLESAKALAPLDSRVIASGLIVGTAATAAYVYGKELANDPAIRARAAAHFREAMGDWSSKRHAAGAAVEGVAKAAGTVHGKFQNVKEGIKDTINRRKATKGFVKTEGHSVYDIAGYLPGR